MAKQMNSKELQKLVDHYESQGCRVVRGDKGYKIYCPNGHILVLHLTLSDGRGLLNFRADSRRQGLGWPFDQDRKKK